MPDWTLALLIAVIAAIPGLAAIILQRRKDTASVAETYENMARRQAEKIDELRACQLELEDKVKELTEYVQHLEAGVNLLIAQLIAHNHEPVWKPKKKKAYSEVSQ